MKKVLGLSCLLLSACASLPQPYCMPEQYRREPETSAGRIVTMPRRVPDAHAEARCARREENARLDAWLLEQDARGRQAEAELLEQELRGERKY
jgi:hypothetical protein